MPGRQGQDVRRAAVELLAEKGEIELDGSPRLAKLDSRDRALACQLVYGVLRNRNLLDYYLARFLKSGDPAELPPVVLNILRTALFQHRFLDRVPDHAAVSQAVELSRAMGFGGLDGLINGVLRSTIRGWDSVVLPDFTSYTRSYLEVRHSHPGWMVSRYLDRFGPVEAERLLAANNKPARLVLRDEIAAGGGKSGLAEILAEAGIELSSGKYSPEALVIDTPGVNPAGLAGFESGLFYVQDEAAMLVGRLAAGDGVRGPALAACAAPGGKATHLARLCGDAVIVACDSSERRIERMLKNLDRLRLTDRVMMACCDARKPALRPRSASLVICDVPCTGTGVIRRKPEIRWRIDREDIDLLGVLQLEILRVSAGLVAPGGALLYSTCSLEPEENRQVVEKFLAGSGDFKLDPAGKYLPEETVGPRGYLDMQPHVHGTDGAFAARMVRTGG
ncbi:MAG: 16S rRNA (cytosine(967)-C(5))-methyltransferase RsmB [Candidatus Glassbacteria bacterium]|nr:16S rRNA (cytosine(967)-C(5))-methyltransferase RsmB [Candidatus Glassbacteria bacterium]